MKSSTLSQGRKPGFFMAGGDFVKHPSGKYVDICEYKNCRNACEEGWIKCPEHIGKRTDNWKCGKCGKFSITPERGVQLCPYCKNGKWIV